MLTIHPDWKQIVKKAWSFRLIALAALLSGAETVLPMFEASFPKGIFSAASGVVTAVALLARVIAQKDLNG